FLQLAGEVAEEVDGEVAAVGELDGPGAATCAGADDLKADLRVRVVEDRSYALALEGGEDRQTVVAHGELLEATLLGRRVESVKRRRVQSVCPPAEPKRGRSAFPTVRPVRGRDIPGEADEHPDPTGAGRRPRRGPAGRLHPARGRP